jgi:hypothetical protein
MQQHRKAGGSSAAAQQCVAQHSSAQQGGARREAHSYRAWEGAAWLRTECILSWLQRPLQVCCWPSAQQRLGCWSGTCDIHACVLVTGAGCLAQPVAHSQHVVVAVQHGSVVSSAQECSAQEWAQAGSWAMPTVCEGRPAQHSAAAGMRGRGARGHQHCTVWAAVQKQQGA